MIYAHHDHRGARRCGSRFSIIHSKLDQPGFDICYLNNQYVSLGSKSAAYGTISFVEDA